MGVGSQIEVTEAAQHGITADLDCIVEYGIDRTAHHSHINRATGAEVGLIPGVGRGCGNHVDVTVAVKGTFQTGTQFRSVANTGAAAPHQAGAHVCGTATDDAAARRRSRAGSSVVEDVQSADINAAAASQPRAVSHSSMHLGVGAVVGNRAAATDHRGVARIGVGLVAALMAGNDSDAIGQQVGLLADRCRYAGLGVGAGAGHIAGYQASTSSHCLGDVAVQAVRLHQQATGRPCALILAVVILRPIAQRCPGLGIRRCIHHDGTRCGQATDGDAGRLRGLAGGIAGNDVDISLWQADVVTNPGNRSCFAAGTRAGSIQTHKQPACPGNRLRPHSSSAVPGRQAGGHRKPTLAGEHGVVTDLGHGHGAAGRFDHHRTDGHSPGYRGAVANGLHVLQQGGGNAGSTIANHLDYRGIADAGGDRAVIPGRDPGARTGRNHAASSTKSVRGDRATAKRGHIERRKAGYVRTAVQRCRHHAVAAGIRHHDAGRRSACCRADCIHIHRAIIIRADAQPASASKRAGNRGRDFLRGTANGNGCPQPNQTGTAGVGLHFRHGSRGAVAAAGADRDITACLDIRGASAGLFHHRQGAAIQPAERDAAASAKAAHAQAAGKVAAAQRAVGIHRHVLRFYPAVQHQRHYPVFTAIQRGIQAYVGVLFQLVQAGAVHGAAHDLGINLAALANRVECGQGAAQLGTGVPNIAHTGQQHAGRRTDSHAGAGSRGERDHIHFAITAGRDFDVPESADIAVDHHGSHLAAKHCHRCTGTGRAAKYRQAHGTRIGVEQQRFVRGHQGVTTRFNVGRMDCSFHAVGDHVHLRHAGHADCATGGAADCDTFNARTGIRRHRNAVAYINRGAGIRTSQAGTGTGLADVHHETACHGPRTAACHCAAHEAGNVAVDRFHIQRPRFQLTPLNGCFRGSVKHVHDRSSGAPGQPTCGQPLADEQRVLRRIGGHDHILHRRQVGITDSRADMSIEHIGGQGTRTGATSCTGKAGHHVGADRVAGSPDVHFLPIQLDPRHLVIRIRQCKIRMPIDLCGFDYRFGPSADHIRTGHERTRGIPAGRGTGPDGGDVLATGCIDRQATDFTGTAAQVGHHEVGNVLDAGQ